MSLPRGTRFGPYEVLSQLGAGGMGEVYRARDTRLKRDVALKVLPERFAQDADALARFHRESTAIAALSHPNIRAIYDIGEDRGQSYAVMELLEGETLGDSLTRSPFDWQKAMEVVSAVATGLAAAHDKSIVHRDIKPQNIFLTSDGGVRILDFGLARLEPRSEGSPESLRTLATLPGTMLGTIQYMSPEQVRGQPADARSDIFAIGCTLSEMLTGVRVFAKEYPAETMAAILNDVPPRLSDSGVDVPDELESIVSRCLEKDPSLRFQNARDLVIALEDFTQFGHARRSAEAHRTPGVQRDGRGATEASVAVLPLVNLSSDRENEYFSDGLAEELINALCKIRGLRVASRTSAFSFKGKSADIREIGRQLNVSTVLEGSVRKAGNRLRISAQLVDVSDGYHLWSEAFDREMKDVFSVQDEIARSIAQALSVVLSDKEALAISKIPTANMQAYDYYLRGRQFFSQFRRAGLERALKLFSRACQLDPEYALAFAGLADCCSLLYTHCDADSKYLGQADEASLKALDLDPELAEAHVARGQAVSLGKRYEEARQEFEIAIKLNGELFEAYYFYGRVCYAAGDLERAGELFAQASRVNPDDYQAPSFLAQVYDGLGRGEDSRAAYARALEVVERHLALVPDDGRALTLGASSLVRIGERERGLEWAQRALATGPEEPNILYNIACNYALLGETDKALDCLDEALTFGWGMKDWLKRDSDLDSLRDHSRFEAILGRL